MSLTKDFTGINVRKLGFTKDFAGINFREREGVSPKQHFFTTLNYGFENGPSRN